MNAPTAPSTQVVERDETISANAMILHDQNFDRLVKFAEMMSGAAVSVPQHLRGKPGDCLAVSMQAMQWGMNPFAVAQKTHFVNGAIGYEAQLVNAVVQQSGAVASRFHYEYRGEGNALECRVGAVLRGEKEVTYGEWLKLSDVTTKNSPLWKTNPRQQLGYLQIKNWARAYTPGAILGVYTADELEEIDMGAAEVVSSRPAIPAALPDYADADLEKNLPVWTKAMQSGKKSAANIIATVSTKYTLSEAQRQRIVEAGAPTVIDADPETGEIKTDSPPAGGDTQDDFLAAYDAAEAAQ